MQSTSKWRDKRSVVHPQNGIRSGLRKETDTCFKVAKLENMMLSEIIQSPKGKCCVIPLT